MNLSIRWILTVGAGVVLVVAGLAAYRAHDSRRHFVSRPVDASPRIQFTRTHVDLAKTPVSKRKTATFPFLNRGDAILKVSELRSSCSCADAKITADRLEPGAGAEIQFSIQPDSVDEGSAAVTVVCNDPLQRETQLIVTWNAVAPLAVDPVELHFGDVEVGRTYRQRVRLVRSSIPAVTATIQALRGEPGSELEVVAFTTKSSDEIEVQLTPTPGSHSDGGYVFVEVAGDWNGTLSVPIFWHTLRDMEIRPTALFLGSGLPESEFTAQLTLLDSPDHPASLVTVASEPALDGLTWSMQRQDEQSSVIRLTGKFPPAAGLHRGELALSLNNGQLLDHRLTWRCVVRQPGNVSADSEEPRDAAE